jgi:uncharacterized membrane protein
MDILHKNKEEEDKHPTLKGKLTLGQRAADVVTGFFGSWAFIIFILIFMAIWMSINVMMVLYRWDPYPFILLNFVLSCLAALQAPVILMSQNRQAERDRITAKYDYQVNRKAEREITDIKNDVEEIKRMLKGIRKS